MPKTLRNDLMHPKDDRMLLDPALSWYALRVKTGRELALVEEIEREGLSAFTPRAVRRVPSRLRTSKTPRPYAVLSGYVFAGVPVVDDLVAATAIDDVYAVLRVDGEPARLCPRSLKQLQDMRPVDPIERYRRGDLVTVIEGPLAGRRVRLSAFVAGKAQIDIPGANRATIPLEHLEAA